MSVFFARIVAREQDIQASNRHQEHGGTENMAGGEWRDTNIIDSMCCVEVDCFYQRECGQMIAFRVQGGALIRGRRCVADSDVVLDQPFVDGLGSMGHEDSAFEVGLAENVGQCGGVVDVKAAVKKQIISRLLTGTRGHNGQIKVAQVAIHKM